VRFEEKKIDSNFRVQLYAFVKTVMKLSVQKKQGIFRPAEQLLTTFKQ
jgi:hypothetical protein